MHTFICDQGGANLVQEPHFWFFTIFPVTLYAVEQVCFRTSHKHTVRLTRVNYDQSNRVLNLAGHVVPKRPHDTSGEILNQAGGWCWVQIPGQPLFKHPFSLSANCRIPETFCLNIRVRGLFTRSLVSRYVRNSLASDGQDLSVRNHQMEYSDGQDLIVYGTHTYTSGQRPF